jgi:uncharacterized protein (DUF1501 family)
MDRRRFLKLATSFPLVALAPELMTQVAWGAAPAGASYRKLLLLIELKGGNDGLNMVVPYTNPTYYTLRPKIGIARDQVVQLSDNVGLHPALEPLLPLWKNRELAVLQGVGYPAPNLSHFRSIEIWDTASKSENSAGRVADPRAAAMLTPSSFCRRWRDHRLTRLGTACRRRHSRHCSGQHGAVPATGPARDH